MKTLEAIIHWLRKPFQAAFEVQMRSRWLEIERAAMDVNRANLEALRAWRLGKFVLQSKWTDEMGARFEKHERLCAKWEADYREYAQPEPVLSATTKNQ